MNGPRAVVKREDFGMHSDVEKREVLAVVEHPDEECVLYEEREGIAWITLNRPDKLNALNADVFRRLGGSLARLEQGDCAVGILHGAGRAFAAGADIQDYVDITVDDYRAFMDVGRAPTDAIEQLSKPVIAAVQGFALGGGFELVLACDLVVVSENARLGLPEPTLGLAPGGGGTQRLPRIVGKTRALEVLLTGRVLTGTEAHEWGIANKVVPKDDLIGAVEELARSIVARPPGPLATIKSVVREGAALPLERALTLEQDETAKLIVTPDALEGITAFVEKRDPVFPGRAPLSAAVDR
jgi:enoyl-CoA hydratase/carnithine racemase